ncbi:hypothetical protein R1flu_014740 [Riccia fluitans]|uniref:DDE Tnp4 domain-containing protein n=1 Tax=Riccia fluitans TaxID=41844 RepID=A0ABD1YKC5_9MARC
MERRNEDWFNRFYLNFPTFNPNSMMGTPLPDSSDSEVEMSQVNASQPANLNELEALFNVHHVRGRLYIEQAFGHLKNKFKIIKHGINSSVTWAAKIAYACCVLNNVLVKYRIEMWQENVVPAYDHIGATAVRNSQDRAFMVVEGDEKYNASDLGKENNK